MRRLIRFCFLAILISSAMALRGAEKKEAATEEAARAGKTAPEEELQADGAVTPRTMTSEGIDALSQPGKEAGERRTCRMNGVEFAFRWAPAGKFVMGSPMDEAGRPTVEPPWRMEIQREETIDRGFWLMETELTRAMWQSVMSYDLCCFTSDLRLPQETISWEHLLEFCDLVEKGTGLSLAPPTEIQWEYACRAGARGAYAGTGVLDEMGWFAGNSDKKTHPVGTKAPNAWGFYDMQGNVWEYCQNVRLRGGCWASEASGCRAALSGFAMPWFRNNGVGARLAVVGKRPE